MVFHRFSRFGEGFGASGLDKSTSFGSAELREAKHEAKTGQGSLRKRKMKQREGFQRKKEAYKVTRCSPAEPDEKFRGRPWPCKTSF